MVGPSRRVAFRRSRSERPTRLTSTAYRQKPGQTPIAPSEPTAVLLVDALRVIGVAAGERGGKAELVIACANGVTAAFKAIDAERASPPRENGGEENDVAIFDGEEHRCHARRRLGYRHGANRGYVDAGDGSRPE